MRSFHTKKKISHKKGFTLIELMVATTIFVIVMVIAIGSVLSIVDANRKAQALNSVINNLNFALESMIRDVRTGTNYSAGTCTINGVSGTGTNCSFSFTSQNGVPLAYTFYQDSLGNGKLQKITNGGTPTDFTAPEVNVQNLAFSISGAGSNDGQPRVLINIGGYAGVKQKIRSNFSLQTLVSQRLADINY